MLSQKSTGYGYFKCPYFGGCPYRRCFCKKRSVKLYFLKALVILWTYPFEQRWSFNEETEAPRNKRRLEADVIPVFALLKSFCKYTHDSRLLLHRLWNLKKTESISHVCILHWRWTCFCSGNIIIFIRWFIWHTKVDGKCNRSMHSARVFRSCVVNIFWM